MEPYNLNYYERGIEMGVSCYQNYRWIPQLTIPMAMRIIDYLEIKSGNKVLDFGCAKGFLVKALRWLNRDAWGLDISKYALANCDPEVVDFCWQPEDYERHGPEKVEYIIAKDVFEHVPLLDLANILKNLCCKNGNNCVMFAIIPLGDGDIFRAPANNLDKTHINCMPEESWFAFFKNIGLTVSDFTFKIKGIKDSYYDNYPTAHGFFTLNHV